MKNNIINIEFDKSKKYTIGELDSFIEQTNKIYDAIRLKKTAIELYGVNFTGKYIYSDVYGYMYVTWQKFKDAFDGTGRKIMLLQGLTYNIGDSSYFNYNSCNEWRIPIDSFISYVKNNKLREITKEEFIKAFEDGEKFLKQEFHSWVRILEEKQKQKEHEKN